MKIEVSYLTRLERILAEQIKEAEDIQKFALQRSTISAGQDQIKEAILLLQTTRRGVKGQIKDLIG